jgi:hypothetical protein
VVEHLSPRFGQPDVSLATVVRERHTGVASVNVPLSLDGSSLVVVLDHDQVVNGFVVAANLNTAATEAGTLVANGVVSVFEPSTGALVLEAAYLDGVIVDLRTGPAAGLIELRLSVIPALEGSEAGQPVYVGLSFKVEHVVVHPDTARVMGASAI